MKKILCKNKDRILYSHNNIVYVFDPDLQVISNEFIAKDILQEDQIYKQWQIGQNGDIYSLDNLKQTVHIISQDKGVVGEAHKL